MDCVGYVGFFDVFRKSTYKKNKMFLGRIVAQKPYKPYTTLHYHKPHDKKQHYIKLWSRLW